MKYTGLLLVLICVAKGILSRPDNGEVVDLSHSFEESTIYWPTYKKFELVVDHNGTTNTGFWLQQDQYSSGIHVGTHLDAPCHTTKGGWTADEIPLNRLMAPAAVVDMTKRAQQDRDALLQVEDLRNWERSVGRRLDSMIVLVRTGWGQKYHDAAAYLGNADNDADNLHFPGVSPQAATWLVNYRHIYGLGIDTPSLDHGSSKDLKAHQILLGKSIYGMENVANLEKLPPFVSNLYVFPMKIKNASGAPVRIVAVNDGIVQQQNPAERKNYEL